MSGTEGTRGVVRHRHTLLRGVALLVLIAGADPPGPPPPLPRLPATTRDDVHLAVEAERDGDDVRVELEVEVDHGGAVLRVPDWSRDEVVGQRLAEGQVVLHLGLAGPERPAGVYTVAPWRPPPPLLFLPGRTRSAVAVFDAPGRSGDGFDPIDRGDAARAEEVRVCLWAAGDDPRPVACADDRL